MSAALPELVTSFVDVIVVAVSRQGTRPPAEIQMIAATEAFALVAALVDADFESADCELDALIAALAPHTDAAGVTAAQLREAELTRGRSAWLARPSELFAALITGDVAQGTHDAWRYHDVAVEVAKAVAWVDGAVAEKEYSAVEHFSTEMQRALADAGLAYPGEEALDPSSDPLVVATRLEAHARALRSGRNVRHTLAEIAELAAAALAGLDHRS